MYSKFEFCGYSKVGIQNLLKIYLYQKIVALRFVGTQKNRRKSNLLVFILKNLLILKIWGTIICEISKFVGPGTENL